VLTLSCDSPAAGARQEQRRSYTVDERAGNPIGPLQLVPDASFRSLHLAGAPRGGPISCHCSGKSFSSALFWPRHWLSSQGLIPAVVQIYCKSNIRNPRGAPHRRLGHCEFKASNAWRFEAKRTTAGLRLGKIHRSRSAFLFNGRRGMILP
jgi:hypothetical protein